jgi:hypothetical protein
VKACVRALLLLVAMQPVLAQQRIAVEIPLEDGENLR